MFPACAEEGAVFVMWRDGAEPIVTSFSASLDTPSAQVMCAVFLITVPLSRGFAIFTSKEAAWLVPPVWSVPMSKRMSVTFGSVPSLPATGV